MLFDVVCSYHSTFVISSALRDIYWLCDNKFCMEIV